MPRVVIERVRLLTRRTRRYSAIVAVFDPLEHADVAVTLPADFNSKYRWRCSQITAVRFDFAARYN